MTILDIFNYFKERDRQEFFNGVEVRIDNWHPGLVEYKSTFELQSLSIGEGGIGEVVGFILKRIYYDISMAAEGGDEELPTGEKETAINNLLGVNYGWKNIKEGEKKVLIFSDVVRVNIFGPEVEVFFKCDFIKE